MVELTEKVKMLETQNLKLIEKNQSDVVEWKTRERDFNVNIKFITQELIKITVGEIECLRDSFECLGDCVE